MASSETKKVWPAEIPGSEAFTRTEAENREEQRSEHKLPQQTTARLQVGAVQNTSPALNIGPDFGPG